MVPSDDMRLARGLHLAHCADSPGRGTWAETFAALRVDATVLRSHARTPDKEFGLGLHLGDEAARELSTPRCLADFRRWLVKEQCNVSTVNAVPETAHGLDWQGPERLAHLCRL